jgi:hypothetical protein
MTDDRELAIKFKKVFDEKELSHWVAIIEYDGEQVYEATGTDLRDAGDKIYYHIWKEDSIIRDEYKYHSVPNPLKGNKND